MPDRCRAQYRLGCNGSDDRSYRAGGSHAGGLVDVGSRCLNDLDVVVLAEDKKLSPPTGISTRCGGRLNVAGFIPPSVCRRMSPPTDSCVLAWRVCR